jgi:hypothetical protein
LALETQRIDLGRALLHLQVLLRAAQDIHALALVEQVAPVAGLAKDRLAVGAERGRLQRIDGLLRIGIGKQPATLADIGLRRALSERDGFLRAQLARLPSLGDLLAVCERVPERPGASASEASGDAVRPSGAGGSLFNASYLLSRTG